MDKVKKQAIDLIEDMFFCLVQEFKLPIQSFDRNEINQSISKLKKVAEENGLNLVSSKAFYESTQNSLFPHLPPRKEHPESQNFSSLYSKLFRLTFFNGLSDKNHSELDQPYTEYLHQLNIEEYLGFKSKYVGTTHIESIALRFSSETTKYKTYLRRKKSALFFEILERKFKERGQKWASVYEVIASEQNDIEFEFKKFDIDWLRSEILHKENFIRFIPQIFSNRNTYFKADYEGDTVLKAHTHFTPDHEEIDEQKKITYQEIYLLNKILDLLINDNPEKRFIENYIPFNSDSLTDTLTKLLNSNENLKQKITL